MDACQTVIATQCCQIVLAVQTTMGGATQHILIVGIFGHHHIIHRRSRSLVAMLPQVVGDKQTVRQSQWHWHCCKQSQHCGAIMFVLARVHAIHKAQGVIAHFLITIRVAEETVVGNEDIDHIRPLTHPETIDEVVLHRIQLMETEKVMEIIAADKRGRCHVFSSHRHDAALVFNHCLAQISGQLGHHLGKQDDKRVFVVVAERKCREHALYHLMGIFRFCASRVYRWVVPEERLKPVA